MDYILNEEGIRKITDEYIGPNKEIYSICGVWHFYPKSYWYKPGFWVETSDVNSDSYPIQAFLLCYEYKKGFHFIRMISETSGPLRYKFFIPLNAVYKVRVRRLGAACIITLRYTDDNCRKKKFVLIAGVCRKNNPEYTNAAERFLREMEELL